MGILQQSTSTVLTTSPHKNPRPILNLLAPALIQTPLYLVSLATTVLPLLSTHILWHSYYASSLLLLQTYYASSFLFLHTYYLLLHTFYVSSFLALQTYYVSSFLALQTYYVSIVLVGVGKIGTKWAWKGCEPLRKKLLFEVAVFVLGGGNGVLLVVFWPGWLVVGPVIWVICG